MKRYRVGVVGARFGAAVHVPAFQAQGRFDVVALASPSSAAAIAAQRGVPRAFGSLDELLAGVDVDVIAVASPAYLHRDHVLAALAAGKHVLCEKPMALDVAQAETMRRAGERAGRVTALAHEFRFVPPVVAIRQLIANGHLGPLREIEVNWMTTWLRAGGDRLNSWWFERARGGGQTGALLSHLIDLASHIAGRYPVRTTGIERTANPQRSAGGESFSSDVADGAFAILDFGEGLVARLGADGTRVVESALVAVHGEMRTAVTSGPRITAMRTFTVDEDETSELEIKPSAHANLAAAHPNLPAFVDLLDQFVRALDGEPAEIPTFADGVATQRALAAIGYGA